MCRNTVVKSLKTNLLTFRKICDLSNEYHRSVRETWMSESVPASPESEGFATVSSEMDIEQSPFKSPRKILPDNPRPLQSSQRTSTAGDMLFEDDRLNKIDREQLKRRGVGDNHICPLGSDCNKGGWSSKDGAKEFPRNSSFLYVNISMTTGEHLCLGFRSPSLRCRR